MGEPLMPGSILCLRAALAASACLFGGPRLFSSRLKVHSTLSSEHGLHGGPDSSHLTLRWEHISQARRKRVSFGLTVGSRGIGGIGAKA